MASLWHINWGDPNNLLTGMILQVRGNWFIYQHLWDLGDLDPIGSMGRR